jgi:phenylalanyl-tRNA synthetase beta chain
VRRFFRFERGIDPTIAYALKRAALLVQEVAGGDITSDLDVYQKKIEDFSVFLNFGNVTKLSQEIPKIRLNRF